MTWASPGLLRISSYPRRAPARFSSRWGPPGCATPATTSSRATWRRPTKSFGRWGCRRCFPPSAATRVRALCAKSATASPISSPGTTTDGPFRHHTADGKDLGHLAKVGTFAEHTVVSTNSIVKIERHLPLVSSALLSCAIPTGYGSVANRANMRAGDTVVVVGVGGIGTGAIQGARINGAAQIVAVDPVEFKQKSAMKFGATHSVATAAEALDLVSGLTYGAMADAVVGSPSLIAPEDVRAEG